MPFGLLQACLSGEGNLPTDYSAMCLVDVGTSGLTIPGDEVAILVLGDLNIHPAPLY